MKISMILIAYLGCAVGLQLTAPRKKAAGKAAAQTLTPAPVYIGRDTNQDKDTSKKDGFKSKEEYLNTCLKCWRYLEKMPGLNKDILTSGHWAIGAMPDNSEIQCMVGPADTGKQNIIHWDGNVEIPAKHVNPPVFFVDLEMAMQNRLKFKKQSGGAKDDTVNYGLHFSFVPKDAMADKDHFTVKTTAKQEYTYSRDSDKKMEAYLRKNGWSTKGARDETLNGDLVLETDAQRALVALKEQLFPFNSEIKIGRNDRVSPATWTTPDVTMEEEVPQLMEEEVPPPPRPTSAPGKPAEKYNRLVAKKWRLRAKEALDATEVSTETQVRARQLNKMAARLVGEEPISAA